MDANVDGKRFLMDHVSQKMLDEFNDHFKEIPAKFEAELKEPGSTAVVEPGEEVITGEGSDFLHTLRNKPGEVIQQCGKTYIVDKNGSWRRVG